MIDLLNLLLFSGAGTIVGLVVGLVPGLGVSSTTLLLAPLLINFNPIYSLFFFICLLTTSQYFGSITTLVYGVPGEMSSFPIINERKHLLADLNNLLMQTAVGSLFAAVVALGCFVALMYVGNFWVYLYNYKVFGWILLAASLAVIFFNKTNSIVGNLFLFVVGMLLSKIGYNRETGNTWGTFGFDDLATGVPLIPVAFGLIIAPNLVWSLAPISKVVSTDIVKNKVIHWASIVRGTLLGIIGGFVPGVTYMASTQLSYLVEGLLNKGPAEKVISTSSADNAGAVSSLYTLLWLGVPISLGEAVIVWLFDKTNTTLNWTTLQQTVPVGSHSATVFSLLLVVFLLANFISYVLSWPGRKISISLSGKLLTDKAAFVIIGLTCLSLYFAALDSYNITVFLLALIISWAAGLRYKTVDWMPLIIGFILQDNIEIVLYKIGVFTF